MKIWSRVRGHGLISSFCWRSGGGLRSGGFGGSCIGRGFGLGFDFGFFLGQARVHLGGFSRVNGVIILVRFCQLLAVEKQAAKAIVGGQLKFACSS